MSEYKWPPWQHVYDTMTSANQDLRRWAIEKAITLMGTEEGVCGSDVVDIAAEFENYVLNGKNLNIVLPGKRP